MDDLTRELLTGIAVKNLNISHSQATQRIEAFIKSGLTEKYKITNPDDMIFQFITDIALSIPQLNEP